MKKILFLVIAGSLLASSVYGITRLTYEQHALKPDEDNNMVLTVFMDPGPGGTNQVWDFTQLNKTKDFNGKIKESVNLKSSKTPYNTELVEFGNSFYFNITKKRIELYGYKSMDGSVRIEYDKPFVKMTYPFEFGDAINGNFSGTVYTGNSQNELAGTYNIEADGYGKLILPNGLTIENTLRVKSVKSYTQGRNNNSSVTITTYRWYTDNVRYPLLVLITTEVGNEEKTNKSYTAAYKDKLEITASALPVIDGNTKVYPNPFKKTFQVGYELSMSSTVEIEIYDMSGRKQANLLKANQEAGKYNPEFNAETLGLIQGQYNVVIRINGTGSVQHVMLIK